MAEIPHAALPNSFTRLAWSNLAAQSAEQIGLAATPIIAVLALGADEGMSGLLQTAQTLPFLLTSIPTGFFVDRMSRARLMAGAEVVRTLSLVTVAALMFYGVLTLPLLAAFGLIGACSTVVYSVAAPALVPSLVEHNMLAVANGKIELARTAAFAAGPAFGGALVGWTGGMPAYGVATALSVLAVVLLVRINEPLRPRQDPRRPLEEIRTGIAFVLRHQLLRPILLTQFTFNAALFLIMAIYAPYAIHHLMLSAVETGLTLSALGAGMMVGAFIAPRIMKKFPLGTVIAIGPVSGCAAALVIVLTIYLPSGWLAGLSFFLMGAGPIMWVVSTTTLRQTVTPDYLLGRVSAINALAYGARSVGAGLGAIVGGLWGAEACLILAAAGFLAQAAIVFLSPVVQLEKQSLRLSRNAADARAAPSRSRKTFTARGSR
jgi:predicted MFS family arabinose efflux permease